MRILFLYILFSASISIASSSKRVAATPTPAPADTTGAKISFKCAICTPIESKNIAIVQAAIPTIINLQCFYDRFVNPKYRSQVLETEGLTRPQVVEKIRTGIVQNIPIEFYFPSWRQSKKVIGYTTPAAPTIYLNRAFRQDSAWGACAEISNALHEVTHKQGFSHDFRATAARPFTVPYTANYAVDECCNDKDYPSYGK